MQATKDKIVQCMIAFIQEQQSFEQITLSKIAKKAGIGKSTVYEHFASKEELIIETYKHLLKHSETILTTPLTSHTFKAQMMEQLAKILHVMKDAKSVMEALLSQSQHAFAHIHKDLQTYAKEIQDKMNHRFQAIFMNAFQEGILTTTHIPPHQGRVVQAIISGLLYQYVNQEFDMDEQALFELIYDNIIVVMNTKA